MTYLVLARKWRPRSFDTLIGQDHVVRALTHALSTQRLHHAWLFTGTRGVGKTTLSRILAKSLNCESGITASPCGTCQACTEIDAGRFVDYVELDAASNRGVEEMTQLLEQAVYAPSTGRFKVYMIDEVQMLTGHAFNAMLKTLEEPPPHVKFILATTDPQKIPVTVLSRCLQFNLKQMTAESIVGHLQGVLDQESIQYETPALRLLAQAASGSMRDALSLTDQAIAYSAGNLTGDAVRGMLGTIDQRHLVTLLHALAQGSASQVLAVADELAVRGLSYSGALADLAVLLSRIAIEQRIPGAAPAEDPLAADIAELAGILHPDQAQLFYSVAVHSRSELSLAPDEYAGFVMACLRMLSLVPPGTTPPEPSGRRPAPAAQPSPAASAQPAATEPAPAGGQVQAQPSVSSTTHAAAGGEAVRQAAAADTGEPAHAGHQAEASKEASNAAEDAAGQGKTSPADAQTPVASSGAAAPAADDIPAWEDAPDATATGGPASAAVAAGNHTASAASGAAAPGQAAQADALQASSASDAAASSVPLAVTPGRARATSPAAPEAPPAHHDDFSDPHAESGGEAATVQHAPQDEGFETMQSEDDSYFDDARFVPAGMDEDDGADETPGGFAMREEAGDVQLPAGIAPARKKKSKSPRLGDMTSAEWPSLAASLPLSGLASELARQSEWLGGQGDQVRLRVAIRSLTEIQGKARLRTVLSEYFGTAVQLEVEFGHTGDETAHAVAQARRAARQKEAEQAVASDPFVQALISDFGAHVVQGSISAAEERAA
jgi:DNA polymerase-3 subunit gamma/tau